VAECDWARFLFPPEKREAELVYDGKEREEEILGVGSIEPRIDPFGKAPLLSRGYGRMIAGHGIRRPRCELGLPTYRTGLLDVVHGRGGYFLRRHQQGPGQAFTDVHSAVSECSRRDILVRS
jgi:hypothetical protein